MAEKVTREEIKPQVVAKLTAVAEPGFPIEEEHELQQDLNMGPTFRAGMALPYTKISQKYGGFVVRINKAKALRTVKASIDLVHKAANRSK